MNTNDKLDYIIHNGDNLATLKSYPNDYFDSIVTDPPYLISFLGKEWDHESVDLTPLFKECLRVLKPGGHLLAFSAARTYHKLASSVEEAGFEIRDQLMWIYASGFPKSQDVGKQLDKKENGKRDKQRFDPAIMIKVSGDTYKHPTTGISYRKLPDINGDRLANSHEGKGYGAVFEEVREIADSEWAGWGSQLKPAHEPVVMARKPIPKGSSIAKNCQKYGTGAINVDECRIPIVGVDTRSGGANGVSRLTFGEGITSNEDSSVGYEVNDKGRFPSNVIGEVSGYEKYFYQPKVSRKERHVGMGDVAPFAREHGGTASGSNGTQVLHKRDPQDFAGNNHPTVKPVALMDYLIKLVTKPGGIVLDPFNGSGSTGMAAVKAGYKYVGCELDKNYCEISCKRIDAWCKLDSPKNNAADLFASSDDMGAARN
jgi:site-specific DNA-methyltransferase (adenine-specific)